MDEKDIAPGREARAEEAAAIRRRWITLGEILAVVAVLISALTLYLNWAEQRGSEAEKAAASSDATAQAATLTLRAEAGGKGDRLEIAPASAEQSIQEQTLQFPEALGASPVTTSGEPRVEAKWFSDRLKRAREKAGLPDDSRGDEKLPVLIETRFIADGKEHRDRAIYDVGYTIRGQILSGHRVELKGLSLARRLKNGGGGAELDARWHKLVPTAKAE
jgi:hypothetical protein